MVEKFVKSDPAFASDKFLIFADIGLNTPKYADTLEKRGNLVLLDHHATSHHLIGRPWAEIDEKNVRCGSKMLCDYLDQYFANDHRRDYVRYLTNVINDFDLWQKKIPLADQLATLMTFLGQTRFVEKFSFDMIRPLNDEVFLIDFEADLVEILESRRDEAIDELVGKATVREITLPDQTRVTVGFVITDDPNISLLLNRMLERKSEIQVAASVSIAKGAVSLRSRNGEPDVSRIAGIFNGGGHKAAAGHRLPQDINELILEHIYE